MSGRLDKLDTRRSKIDFAQRVRNEAGQAYREASGESILGRTEQAPPDSAFYTYVLNLRLSMEKNGGVDYRLLAEKLWGVLEGGKDHLPSKPYDMFVGSMVMRMQSAPIENILYPHVLAGMPKLIRRYKNSIAHLSLWSQGDVSRTGYQIAYVENTNIVPRFIKSVAAEMKENGDSRTFLDERTAYDVADDKFKNISDYAKQQLALSNGRLKLVIIDDRVQSFASVEERIRAELGEEAAKRVDTVPIWATYSRRGTEEKKQAAAAGQEGAFAEKKRFYNAIDSFDELLDEKRFGGIFKDAHLFVDFDGVIASDANTRQFQVNAIFSACIDGLSRAWKLSREETAVRINEKLTRGA